MTKQNSEQELLPCPWCDCDQIQIDERLDWSIPFARYCRNCRAYGPHKATLEQANEAWNTRPNQPDKGKEISAPQINVRGHDINIGGGGIY
jgi:hypothetical protein